MSSEVETMRPPTGVATLLLVDDQPFVRKHLARALSEHGFLVHEAGDVRTALAWLERDPSISLIVTDLVLPGGGGMEILRRARQERPERAVVLMSGFVVDHDLAQAKAAGAIACLSKPFSLDQLVPVLWQAADNLAARGD